MTEKVLLLKAPAVALTICSIIASILVVISFTTPAWCVNSRTHHFEGLLESCVCAANNQDPPIWFIFSQVASVVILVAMQVGAVMAWDHYYSNCISKSKSIIALAVISIISVGHMVAVFIIYGVQRNGLDWSYALTVAGNILFFSAGALAVIQRVRMRPPQVVPLLQLLPTDSLVFKEQHK